MQNSGPNNELIEAGKFDLNDYIVQISPEKVIQSFGQSQSLTEAASSILQPPANPSQVELQNMDNNYNKLSEDNSLQIGNQQIDLSNFFQDNIGYKYRVVSIMFTLVYLVMQTFIIAHIYSIKLVRNQCQTTFTRVFLDSLIFRDLVTILFHFFLMKQTIDFRDDIAGLKASMQDDKMKEIIVNYYQTRVQLTQNQISELFFYHHPNSKNFNNFIGWLKVVHFLISLFQVAFSFTQHELNFCQKWRIILIVINLSVYYIFLIVWVILLAIAITLGIIYVAYRIVKFYQFRQKQIQNQKKIENLPTQKFTDIKDHTDQHICSICLLDYNDQTDEIITLKCHQDHNFHANCIRAWLKMKAECPICRKDL